VSRCELPTQPESGVYDGWSMKVSLLCGAHYAEASAHRLGVLPSSCDPHVARESFGRWLRYAAAADELGFDWISVSEHHYSPLILVPSVGPLAGALTQIVRRARIALLGPLVSINNPVRIAEEIAMLDQLSDGRLNVLLLRGTPNEFGAYEPIDPKLTQQKTQAAAHLIQKALTETMPFAWHDEFFNYPNIAIWPRPLQQPLPPMYFSSNSPSSAEFAARERLGVCISFHRPEAVADIVERYRAEARRCGWEPTLDQIVYRGFGLVADTDARAAQLEAQFLPPHQRFLLDGPAPSAPGNAKKSTDVDQSKLNEATPFGMGRMLFAGSPDTVGERLRVFQSLTGVGVVDLVFSSAQLAAEDEQRSIELFGREVLPRVHSFDAAAARAPIGAT
jgi:alkanesulfonate monooxygenase SsuD/methylene tetrahydromethanopterin reductase-like flavin-dependent oxidoreductase (luciferase family)